MQVAAMILGCLLVGQTPDTLLSAPASQEKRSPAVLEPTIKATTDVSDVAAAASAPATNKPAPGRLTPPEIVANAMVLSPGSTPAGQPWTLFNVLSSTTDRRQQLEMTRAYWRLVQAIAEDHFCADHAGRLGRMNSAGGDAATPRLAQASAAAMLHQAELQATEAQYELARLLRLPAGAPLPLPADRPHVGAYRTNFQALFAGRVPPEPAALMDRILPIRRRSIDEQAAAVQAAADVLAAATDQPPSGRGDAGDVIACSQELLQQQRTFMRTVCDYNRNIADYALVVTGPTISPQALVAILIGPVPQAAPAGSVQTAAANERIAEPMRQAVRNGWQTSEPTLAPPRDAVKKNEPTLAPARDGLQAVGKNEPTLAPPRNDSAAQQPANLEDKPAVRDDRSSAAPALPQPRTANKPVVAASSSSAISGETAAAAVPATSPLYPALHKATPAVRAKELTAALHWDRSLPQGIGTPMTLLDCLMRDGGTDRQATINAYWRVRQRAAEYQVLAQQAELLEAFEALALEHRKAPSGAVEMLRLRRTKLAADASLREAHVALIEAQYALALRIGATGDSSWPLASTVPHAGKYLLMIEAQPQAVAQSWPVRRLAATIPALGESVEQHAVTVVEADAARVAAAERYRTGASLDQAIEGVTTQTRLTLALLETLTDYNRAIAEYALTVFPPAVAADRLVPALVLKP